MSSLRDSFNELLARMRHGRDLGQTSYKPIYYLVFPPRQILEVKREVPAWMARLRNENWVPHRCSMAQAVADVLRQAPPGMRKLWLLADRASPLAWEKTNQSLANQLLTDNALQARLSDELARLKGQPRAVLLVTDIEGLHPYLRVGAIENQLYTEFCLPTIFFNPGERTGKSGLKFLGFYHADGNYRSVHVGG
jgi:hypothetical protein